MYEGADIDPKVSEAMTARHGRLLAANSALAARLVADLAERALAAETTDEAAKLAKAFHTVSRSLRQSVALEQRLERAAGEAQRQARVEIARSRDQAVAQRKAQVRHALRPLVWTEAEALEVCDGEDEDEVRGEWCDARFGDLEDLIETAAEADPEAFLAEPLDAQVARLTADLSLADDHAGDEPAPHPGPRTNSGRDSDAARTPPPARPGEGRDRPEGAPRIISGLDPNAGDAQSPARPGEGRDPDRAHRAADSS